MNGDVLTTLDYRTLLSAHREREAWGTIAVSQREVVIEYGVISASVDGWLREYKEKPKIRYDVSMGINVLSSNAIQFIPKDGKFDLPDLILALHRAGKPVLCFKSDCYWQDIGLFEDYQRASEDFTNDRSRFIAE